jgi:hypothetical protein
MFLLQLTIMDNIVFSVTIVTGNYKSILQKIDDQHEM